MESEERSVALRASICPGKHAELQPDSKHFNGFPGFCCTCATAEAEREPKVGQDPDRMAIRDSRSEKHARKLKKQASQRRTRRAEMPAWQRGKRTEDKKQQMTQHTAKEHAKINAQCRLPRKA